jgi:hypothetical protein
MQAALAQRVSQRWLQLLQRCGQMRSSADATRCVQHIT